ncbi:metal ABC transporter ATP-binding protein [Klugiella xanthotipulae]|uniref:Manganese transport system ATP-binding protein n=2 Tax=Klugiella xanthotipulae TaxID=244735 RepID=A0A543HRZ9_9MICO|nr:manganese transport system ATP-binding protein [Klugiella xanthotipulae]
MAADDVVLELREVSVSYGTVRALEGASLRLRAGVVTGLVGVNGSGKSTLMKSILGLVQPTSGTVTVRGGSVAAARRKASITYVPQTESIDETFPLSVGQVVEMGRYGRLGMTRRLAPADRAACREAVARTGTEKLVERSIGELSGGQRKRVFLARAIAQGADILLLDEPFSGVDATSQREISAVIRSLAAEGVSVLISSHDVASLPGLCDSVVLWYRRALFEGSPADALSDAHLARAFAAGLGEGSAGAVTGEGGAV